MKLLFSSILAAALLGCAKKQSDCSFKMPEHYRVVFNPSTKCYAIAMDNGLYLAKGPGSEPESIGFDYFGLLADVYMLKDTCELKDKFQQYLNEMKKRDFK